MEGEMCEIHPPAELTTVKEATVTTQKASLLGPINSSNFLDVDCLSFVSGIEPLIIQYLVLFV